MKTKNMWKPWIEIVEKGSMAIRKTLDCAPKSVQVLVALALSVAKWHPLRKEMQGFYANVERVSFLRLFPVPLSVLSCGLCQLYWNQDTCERAIAVGRIEPCPLVLEDECCTLDDTIYGRWYLAYRDEDAHIRRELANEMFELLMKLYEKEYKKVIL